MPRQGESFGRLDDRVGHGVSLASGPRVGGGEGVAPLGRGGSVGITQSAGIGVKAWGPSLHRIGGVGENLGETATELEEAARELGDTAAELEETSSELGETAGELGVERAATQPANAMDMIASALATRRLLFHRVDCARIAALACFDDLSVVLARLAVSQLPDSRHRQLARRRRRLNARRGAR